jgi:hypothetical protein
MRDPDSRESEAWHLHHAYADMHMHALDSCSSLASDKSTAHRRRACASATGLARGKQEPLLFHRNSDSELGVGVATGMRASGRWNGARM